MSKQSAGKSGADRDSMDSYADDYYTTESAYISPYGTAVRRWKPRTLSAKRDFPKAFDGVTMQTLSSVSKDGLQNITAIGFDVPQLPKRRKVAVVRDFPIGMTGNYKEYVGRVESKEGSTDSGTFHLPDVDAKVVSDNLVPFEMGTMSSGGSINREMPSPDYEETDIDAVINKVIRDLADESTKIVSDDLVPSEMDSMTSGGSINRDMLGSDYGHTDLNTLTNTNIGRTLDLPYEGAMVVSDDLVCESSGSSINREMLSSDYEDADLDQLIKTHKRTIDLPYEGARVVSDDLVCESSGSSINRQMPSSDYEDKDMGHLIKTHKLTIDLPYEGARVVSDDLVSESSGSSINRQMLSLDYEDRNLDQLIETHKRTIDLPYEGARVVSDDLVCESSGSSINRQMLSLDYEDRNLDQLIKTHKRTIDLPYEEGARVVSDDLVCESSGSSINRQMFSLDYEDRNLDQLIKTRKRTIDLPYEGARVVSDDLVSESSGGSINRHMLSSDYEDGNLKQFKTRKRTIDLPYEGARVVSDDLVSESSGSSINREMLSSDYEDTDLDKLNHTDNGKFDLPYEGTNKRDDLDTDYKEEERYKDEITSNEKKVQVEDDMLGPYTELKIHGASVKDIRWNQSQGQIHIQMSIDNLQKYSISIKPSGKESGIHKRAVKSRTTNHTDSRKQLHSRKKRATVVRCFPPGCGPDT